MAAENKFIVITTIHPKSKGIEYFEKVEGWRIILVGDEKSAPIRSTQNATFLSIKDQHALGFETARLGRLNHYARKNVGYLYAMQNGADIIYDTDDDNFPYQLWQSHEFSCASFCASKSKFINIYQYFTDKSIWPRGFPLDEIHNQEALSVVHTSPRKIGVWQSLADIDPDVDAIYRLVTGDEVTFEKSPPIGLKKGQYCPFNSQNTFWQKEAFSYLYLPSTVSFRFTDILRSYIAQRLMWDQELYLGFIHAMVYQIRNSHDLMKDFADEIECYVNTKSVVSVLDSISGGQGAQDNLAEVYSELAAHQLVQPKEMELLDAWLTDIGNINSF